VRGQRCEYVNIRDLTPNGPTNRGPFELIYYEACLNQQDDAAREKYLKSGMGKRYLKNRLKRFLISNGVNPGP